MQNHIEGCLDDYEDASKLPQQVLDAAHDQDMFLPDFIYLAPLSIEGFVRHVLARFPPLGRF